MVNNNSLSKWRTVSISALCSSLTYGTSQKSQSRGKYVVLRMGNLQGGFIDWSDLVFTDDEYDIKRYNLVPGDVLFNRTNSPDLVGKTSIYRGEMPAIYAGYLIKLDYDRNEIIGEYLNYVLNSPEAKKYCLEIKTDGVSQSNINAQKIGDFKFALPAYQEQRKIVDTICDMDNMIASLEKLVAKKKSIKQGAMQDLFSGEIIVPGTSGKWQELRIRDAGYLTKVSVNPQDHPDEIYTEYSMPSYDNGRSPVITKGSTMHSNRIVIDGEVLLFNKLNVRQRRIWYIPECAADAVCSAEFLAYKSEELDLQLLSQILNTDKVTDDFINMSTGTSNSQRRITPADFMDYIVKVPKDRNEQKAIASVLFDMDKEIESLEKKLAKCRQTKEGMMRQLLTGNIRLI